MSFKRGLLPFLFLGLIAAEPKDEKPQPWQVPNHTMQRAGYPLDIACYAAPSITHSYVGYYVGGGAPCGGRLPGPNEGTWGWDYQGCVLPRRVFLGWWHRYQGGVGSYRTDGPHIFPHIRE
jgi:hypothetical protein